MVDFDSDIDVGDDIVGSSVSGPVQPVAGKTIATKFVQFVIPSDTSGTAMTLAEVMTSTPAGTEAGVVTRPIIDSLPLPSGAATEAKQDTIIGHVDGIEGALTTLNAKDFATQTTLAALNTKIDTVADNAGFTDGTTKVLPVGYIFDEVAGTALTENDAAAARIDSKRAQVFTLEDGTTRGNRASVEVPGSYNVGIVYTNKGLSVNGRSHQIWDPSHPDNATADSGSPAGDGNWYGQNQESNGNLCTNISSIRGELLRYRNQTGVVQSGTNPPPLWIGGAAATVTPSSVTASRAVDGYWSKSGHLVVNLDSVREQDGDQLTTLTSTTTVTTIVTADATYMNDLTGLIITNTSATATDVIIYNDDGTTERTHIYAPAGDTRGIVFGKPFKQTAINKAWKAKTVTSVASVYITAQFSKQL